MARWPASLLLTALAAALAAAHVVGGPPACYPRKWQCVDGTCIDASLRCDGVLQCPDASDEVAAMCDEAPSVRVRAGDVTTVRVECDEWDEFEFHLCDASSCSKLWLWALNPEGALTATVYTECNARGGGCDHDRVFYPKNVDVFPAGLLIFKVELRPREVAVWLDGHADLAITVPVKEGTYLLRAKPHFWNWQYPIKFAFAMAEANVTSAASDSVDDSVLQQSNTTGSDSAKSVEKPVRGGDRSTEVEAEAKDGDSAVALRGRPSADGGVELQAVLLDSGHPDSKKFQYTIP